MCMGQQCSLCASQVDLQAPNKLATSSRKSLLHEKSLQCGMIQLRLVLFCGMPDKTVVMA